MRPPKSERQADLLAKHLVIILMFSAHCEHYHLCFVAMVKCKSAVLGVVFFNVLKTYKNQAY